MYSGTNTTCFLCSREVLCADTLDNEVDVVAQTGNIHSSPDLPIKIEADTHSSSHPAGKISLKSIFRYIGLNFKQIVTNFDNGDVITLQDEEIAFDCSALFCCLCSKIIEPLTKMCVELELLQMKMDYCLKSIRVVLEQSETQADNQFGHVMTAALLRKHEFDKLLRKEIKRKCEIRSSQVVPKVGLIKDPALHQRNVTFVSTPARKVTVNENTTISTTSILKGAAVLNDGTIAQSGNAMSSQLEQCFENENRPAKNSEVTDDDEDSQHSKYFIGEAEEPPDSSDHSDFECEPGDESSDATEDSEDSVDDVDNVPSRTRKVSKTKVGARVQICDLCKAQVPTTDIYEHVQAHVGEEYLVPCPGAKCPKVFSSFWSLYLHLKRRGRNKSCRESIPNIEEVLETTKNKVCHCQICGYRVNQQQYLLSHLLRMHETPTKNFSCPIENCSQRFTLKQSVQLHLSEYEHDIIVFNKQMCAVCKKRINVNEMDNHLRGSHAVQQVISCNRCPFLFSTRDQLVEHLSEHKGGSGFSCDICGDAVKFSRHTKLRQHYFNFHQIGNKYNCTSCSSIFWTRRLLEDHNNQIHKQGSSPNLKRNKKGKLEHKCDICDSVLKSEASLRNHKIKLHGSELYSCKFCAETFHIEQLLCKHEKEHTEGAQPEKVYTCQVEGCGKQYNVRSSLQYHMQKTHLSTPGEKPYVCELCGKSYAIKSYLLAHNDTVHLKIRSYVCEVCGKGFGDRRTLKGHMLTHGERSHECKICGKSFARGRSLRYHLVTHSNERPHKCKICGNCFKCKRSLKSHLLTHTEERQHECQICHHRFRLKSDLKRHVELHDRKKGAYSVKSLKNESYDNSWCCTRYIIY